jgi:hypothetical protein
MILIIMYCIFSYNLIYFIYFLKFVVYKINFKIIKYEILKLKERKLTYVI